MSYRSADGLINDWFDDRISTQELFWWADRLGRKDRAKMVKAMREGLLYQGGKCERRGYLQRSDI